MRWVIVAMALAVSAPASADTWSSIGPRRMTPDGATIPRGGGVLFGFEETHRDDEGRDATVQKGWRFRRDGARSKPTITRLAPGLTVYVPRTRGEVELVDGEGEVLGRFESRARTARFAPAAPELGYVHLLHHADGSEEWSWSVDFAEPLPADAVAVILYAVDGRRRTPIHWYPLGEDFRPDRLQPPGLRLPEAGEQVEVRWIDAFGRRSPASKVVTVGTAEVREYSESGFSSIEN